MSQDRGSNVCSWDMEQTKLPATYFSAFSEYSQYSIFHVLFIVRSADIDNTNMPIQSDASKYL